jgi:predicted transcriptional regulator
MTDTPPPAASDAIEAATMAVYDHRMPDGDALGVLLHESHYIDDSPPIAEQLAAVRDLCKDIVRSAIAAYHAALPSEFGELTENLSDLAKAVESTMGYVPGKSVNIFRQSVAAITALEAWLADARAQEITDEMVERALDAWFDDGGAWKRESERVKGVDQKRFAESMRTEMRIALCAALTKDAAHEAAKE